jgi:hypothetical protein
MLRSMIVVRTIAYRASSRRAYRRGVSEFCFRNLMGLCAGVAIRSSGLIARRVALRAARHGVNPKLAGPDSEAPMECAAQRCLAMVTNVGSYPRDWVACSCEPPTSESEPKLGQESERSNVRYPAKRPDEGSSRRGGAGGEFRERPFVR